MQNEFRFFNLGLASRLTLAACLYAAASALGLLVPPLAPLGLVLAVLAWLPLMLRPASNKPADQGLEEWRPVPMAEFDKLDDSLRASKELRAKTRGPGTTILALLLFVNLAIFGLLRVFDGGGALFLSWALFFVPAVFFGKIQVFTPGQIAFKMPSFRAVLSETLPDGCSASPYIRFDKDDKGRDVPEDIRLMLELKRPPKDFVGIQLQTATNKGPNGEVPYMYAVVLTRGDDGPSYAAAAGLSLRGYKLEAGPAKDGYGSVVIRQSTQKGDYHTSPDDCRELARHCVAFMKSLA